MKVAIFGLGRVGSRIAFCLMKNKNVDEILLELCKLIAQVDEKIKNSRKDDYETTLPYNKSDENYS